MQAGAVSGKRGRRRVCPQCGAMVFETDPVCVNCGADLRPPAPAAAPEPELVQPQQAAQQAAAAAPEIDALVEAAQGRAFDALFIRHVMGRWTLFLSAALFMPGGGLVVPLAYYFLGVWGARVCETDAGVTAAERVMATAANWMGFFASVYLVLAVLLGFLLGVRSIAMY